MFDEHLSWKSHTRMVTNKLAKVVGILNRLKRIYPEQILLTIYNSLFISHINYGLLLWWKDQDRVNKLQKKAVRIVSGSQYLAHTEPLFKHLNILKAKDLYSLKLLKFYYNLSYGSLPSYFDCYMETINKGVPHRYSLRTTARPMIRMPKSRLVLTESCVLHKLINLINQTNTNYPQIICKIEEQSHTFWGFSFNITQIYLQSYDE